MDKAGAVGTITITTPMLGRGTDFKTKAAHGFVGINLITRTTVEELGQMYGRVGRNGQEGAFVSIFNRAEMGAATPDQTRITYAAEQRAIRERNQPISEVRAFFQAAFAGDSTSAILFNKFLDDKWEELLTANAAVPHGNLNKGLRKQLAEAAAEYPAMQHREGYGKAEILAHLSGLDQQLKARDQLEAPALRALDAREVTKYSIDPVNLKTSASLERLQYDCTQKTANYLNNSWFISKDRTELAKVLKDKIEEFQNPEAILTAITEAMKTSVENDLAKDKERWPMFRRNHNGSRFLDLLTELSEDIYKAHPEIDKQKWATVQLTILDNAHDAQEALHVKEEAPVAKAEVAIADVTDSLIAQARMIGEKMYDGLHSKSNSSSVIRNVAKKISANILGN